MVNSPHVAIANALPAKEYQFFFVLEEGTPPQCHRKPNGRQHQTITSYHNMRNPVLQTTQTTHIG
jgi:hypothetical protein